MSAGRLVGELESAGVTLWEDDGRLRFRAPKGTMTEERIAALREHRDEVLAYLRDTAENALVPAPGDRYEPFPVTDVQSAYLLGRRDVFAYGGVGCHGYGELTYPELDPARLEAAWRRLIERHDMLRAVVTVDGAQQVRPSVPDYHIHVADLRGSPPEQVAAALGTAREEMGHKVYPTDQWPLFELRVTLSDQAATLHFSIDFLIADFVSLEVLLDELHRLYAEPKRPLPPLEVTYRDYRLAEQRMRSGPRYERDKAYWLDRIDDLPAAPDLPLLTRPAGQARFRRLETRLDPATWAALKEQAGRHGLSPSTAVLAAYAEVIGSWSRAARFSLDITLLNRLPVHPQIGNLVGDFTSVSLLAVDKGAGTTFAERAAAVQAQLWQDLDHRLFTGVEVMRELGRRRGPDAALMPVVFTSAIGLADEEEGTGRGEFTHGISQTPQVWIDCQNIERRGGLSTNWDVREGVLADEMVDDAFAAYEELLRRLAGDPGAWAEQRPVGLPAAQLARREQANATAGPLPDSLLQDGFLEQAARHPGRTAVISGDDVLTYADLAARSATVAARLAELGLAAGDRVAVVMDKGWEQVVAVIAVLRAGGVYLPIDTNQPQARRERILADADVRLTLTQSWLLPELGGAKALAVDEIPPAAEAAGPPPTRPDDLAYVIYTSGSTGSPKGVMISHRAARNTIDDINARFQVGPDDRVLGLAALGFDLSVYDLFGLLAAGGALVLPAPARRGDPSHWAALVAQHGVTIWNSVPAQLQMLSDYLGQGQQDALGSLRLALLSGDWIPVALPDQVRQQLPGLRTVSLGGATEAAIWSIYHDIGEVPGDWRSIPYGRPLTNQTFHVLDAAMRPCPDGVAGELYIGGAGLAAGYLNDEQRTAERFVRHPETGERLYRTGDLGRYLPNGEIEFLGREDAQVKVRGHRIELAEVETVLAEHPAVDVAVCVADGTGLERRLIGFVEPAGRAEPAEAASGVLAEATRSGAAVLDGVDRERYLAYTRGLDDIALTTMLAVLTESGLFAPGSGHTAEDVAAVAGVAERHHRLVRRWLHALTGAGVLAVDGAGVHRLTGTGTARLHTDLTAAWQEVVDLGTDVDDVRLIDYFRTCSARLGELVRGEADPLELLFPEGRVDLSDDLYSKALFNRWANAVTAAAVRRIAGAHDGHGPLRVLEVGAGAGGTSAGVLDALTATGVDVDYLYTDLSQYFLNAAQDRFAVHEWLRFGVFDLDRDHRAQSLSANSFDLIIAGDVLHATTDVSATLTRLAELAAPGGWLLVQEMTRDHFQIMTSLELMVRLDDTGDFADLRRGAHQTFLSAEQWRDLLSRAGAREVCATHGEDLLEEVGMRVMLARFKTDRARVTPAELARFAARRLPDYMVPPVIEVIDAVPVTGNAKVDRAGLLALLPTRGGVEATAPDEGGSDLERRLAEIWAQVLKLDAVGRHQNFYDLGGDSLLAAQLAGRVTEEVPEAGLFFDELLRLILEQPTIAAVAAALSGGTGGQTATSGGAASSVVPLGEQAGQADGPALIVVHDGHGPLPAPPADVPSFALTGAAGLAVDELEPEILVERLADRYCAELADLGLAEVRMTGSGAAALLAMAVARRLVEIGVHVDRLTLVGPLTPGAEEPPPGADGLHRALLAAGDAGDELYLGDLTLVVPEGTPVDFWTDRCLGEVTVEAAAEPGVGPDAGPEVGPGAGGRS
ncbi:pyochelin synthetase [Nonomuraea muscovyensis]|uniref:Phenyloxazoline synthase MbtB n=1 Tax=Nonomuraea muscovyensis TaxID=1124761 RepID=A0A7X0EX87_9ACTN|nr:non-ribosomal peptide synthetase [Nonomuraea muscovyensis]MBB6347807.1 pyochelin synthetase [Nonomuraea muscovyensis]